MFMQVRLPPDSELPPKLQDQGEQLGLGLTEPEPLGRVGRMIVASLQTVVGWTIGEIIKAASWIAVRLATTVMRGEDRSAVAFQELTRAAIQDLTGADPGTGKRAIGSTLLNSLAGGAGAAAGGQLAPSTEGAEAYMEMVMQLALEGYVEGGITSALSLGYLDKFTELDDILANVLGLGRMSRRVMGPLMNAKVITPFQWHVNKQYRPELLSVADAVRQYLRGRWSLEQLQEELARQGWSSDRIEALINGQRKFFSAGDVRTFVTREHWTAQQGLQHLMDQGYSEAEAQDALRLEGLRRFESLEAQEAGYIIGAYVDGRISAAEFSSLMGRAVANTTERNLLTELAEIRRAVDRKFLTSSEERRLARAGIRSVVDYRRALEREGYVDDAVTALELELRQELAADRDREELKAEQAADKAAAAAQAAQEREARLAAIAVEKALPSVAELRRAYVRGHVPIDRYAAAVAQSHPGITPADLAALVADAETDRARQLEAEEQRKAAEAHEADAALPLGALEQAVLRGLLSIEEYARDLAGRGYDEAEINLLAGVLRGRLEDQQAAAAKRAEAERQAAAGGVSLSAWERAVRLRVRTLDQYRAYLASIATPEIAQALILDTLAAQLAQDDEARAKRDAREAAATPKTLSLERRRRAVLLGVDDVASFERALAASGLSVEDQRIERDLLAVELVEADEARARRDAIAAEQEARRQREETERQAREQAGLAPAPATELSLAQVERAVKLGLLEPDALYQHAIARGYDPADAELLVELALFAVPDLREGERRRTAIAAELAAKAIALSDLESAVLRGLRSLDDYAADLAGRGYGEDDVALLRQLLAERVAIDVDGLRRKIEGALAKAPEAPTLAALVDGITSGSLSPDAAIATLEGAGVAADSVLVFVRLLLSSLEG